MQTTLGKQHGELGYFPIYASSIEIFNLREQRKSPVIIVSFLPAYLYHLQQSEQEWPPQAIRFECLVFRERQYFTGIRVYGIVGIGMVLWEKECHWGGCFEVSNPQTRPSAPYFFIASIQMQLLQHSVCLCATMLPGMMIRD